MDFAERYSRQIMLPELGAEGQKRLSVSKVLLIGAGGLGSPIATYLTAAGIGTLGIIDADKVSESNLQRQTLYSEDEIGMSKVECASKRLQRLNGNVKINVYDCFLTADNAEEIISGYDIIVDGCDNFATRFIVNDTCLSLGKPYVYGSIQRLNGNVKINVYDCFLTADNAEEIISGYDIIVDGCDNFATRFIVNDTCLSLGKPYVYGSIQGLNGQVSVFGMPDANGKIHSYRDLYDEQELLSMTPPSKAVLGITPAVTGSVEANQVLQIAAGFGEPLIGKLWCIDLRTMESYIIDLF